MHQIGLGMSSYASANDSYYPARHPKANTYNHAYWFGQVGKADQDLHEQFEKYLGGAADGRPPRSAGVRGPAPGHLGQGDSLAAGQHLPHERGGLRRV